MAPFIYNLSSMDDKFLDMIGDFDRLQTKQTHPTNSTTPKAVPSRPVNDSSCRKNFESTCNYCGKPASERCSGCKDAPAFDKESSYIVYCNSACQKSDWAKHKSVCKVFRARKSLFRAGDILQAAFYQYREHMFDCRISKIEKKGKDIFIHVSSEYSKLAGTPVAMYMEPFPLQMSTELGIKEEVLVHASCSDALAWMYDMMRYLLEGITCDIEEVCFEVKNIKTNITLTDEKVDGDKPREKKYNHHVWKVKLEAGQEEYLIDLTAAQYGFGAPVQSWSDFSQVHFRRPSYEVNRRTPFLGGVRDNMAADLELPEWDYLRHHTLANISASQTLVPSLLKVESKLGTSFAKIMQLNGDKFQKAKELILKNVNESLQQRVKLLKSNATKSCKYTFQDGRITVWQWCPTSIGQIRFKE